MRLVLANPSGFELNANSFSGSIRSELPLTIGGDADDAPGGDSARRRDVMNNHSMRATFGDGSATLMVRTFSGRHHDRQAYKGYGGIAGLQVCGKGVQEIATHRAISAILRACPFWVPSSFLQFFKPALPAILRISRRTEPNSSVASGLLNLCIIERAGAQPFRPFWRQA